MLWALCLTGGFMVLEALGGFLSGSLALIADAGHMLTDTASLGLAWYAFHVSRRPANKARSYGYHRFQVLAAFLNGITLLGVVVWIMIEAAQRLFAPVEILGGTMFLVAAAGLLVNIAAFFILHGGDRANLNMRGALLHVLGDMLGSVGALVAAGVIMTTGWTPIDPILSVVVALLVLRSAWMLLNESWHVLMEGTPRELDEEQLGAELVGAVPDIVEVHHVHVWSLTPGRPLATLHALVTRDTNQDEVLRRASDFLHRRFKITHATIQVERDRCAHGSVCSPADAHPGGHRH